MNKAELVKLLSGSLNSRISQPKLREVLDALSDIVYTEIESGGSVTISGFGKFSAKLQQETNMWHNGKKEVVTLPATVRPKFTPALRFTNMKIKKVK